MNRPQGTRDEERDRIAKIKTAACQGCLSAALGEPLHTVADSGHAARSYCGDAWEAGWEFINGSATWQQYINAHRNRGHEEREKREAAEREAIRLWRIAVCPSERTDEMATELEQLGTATPEACRAIDAWNHRLDKNRVNEQLTVLRKERVAAEQARDEAVRELALIDSVIARRPALDKPTRWQNIEHAIATAARADEANRKIAGVKHELDKWEPCCDPVLGVESMRERLEFYKLDNEECGKAVGCDHVEDGHARCVSDEIERLNTALRSQSQRAVEVVEGERERQLAKAKAALDGYDSALKRREDGALAAWRCVDQLRKALTAPAPVDKQEET